jgi:hypothetical protein
VIVSDGSGVADRDAIVRPAFGSGKDVLCHLLGSHGGPRRNFDWDAHICGRDLDVGTADVNDENFHIALDVSSVGDRADDREKTSASAER